MIDLYYWPTPDGHKVTLFLEEAALAHRIHPINVSAGDQFRADFRAISPNNPMPAIVDTQPHDGGAPISLFELEAILFYLAETVQRWLFWQLGGLGPMVRDNHHFGHYTADRIPHVVPRYVHEASGLYRVLDRRLASNRFVVGDGDAIADMTAYLVSWQGQQ